MEIHITRDGQQFGPYTLDDVNAYLASGELDANDMAWHDGMADWLPLRSIEGIVAPRSSALPPPPATRSSTNPIATSLPALYKPVHATTGTLFFTMIWGAAITRANWLALGRSKEAGRSLMLIWGGVVYYVFAGVLDVPGGLLLWLIPVVIWYLMDYKPQAKFVEAHIGPNYPQRSYLKPVLIGFASLAFLVVLSLAGTTVSSTNPK